MNDNNFDENSTSSSNKNIMQPHHPHQPHYSRSPSSNKSSLGVRGFRNTHLQEAQRVGPVEVASEENQLPQYAFPPKYQEQLKNNFSEENPFICKSGNDIALREVGDTTHRHFSLNSS